MEVMSQSPLVLIDGAHNLHGAKSLAETLKVLFDDKNIIALVGILGDKDVSGILDELMPLVSEVICTEPANPRKMPAEDLLERVSAYGVRTYLERDLGKGFQAALAIEKESENAMILCFGSLYLVGQLRGIIRSELGL